MTDSLLEENLSLESLVGQVADEFLRLQEQGERPDIEEYAARYPQAAPVLRKVLASLAMLERSATGATGPFGSAPESLMTGRLGDFRILQEIGRGGMGIVYQAEQISLGRRVALKVLPFAATLDPKQLQRFKNEAQAAAHLHHTNIVPVFGVGSERGVHYYAMQYIEGQTLATIIRELRRNAERRMTNDERITNAEYRMPKDGPKTNIRHSTLDLLSSLGSSHSSFFRTVAHLGVQAAEALDHAHAKGIIHRDIKPANLLVDVSGNLWITDFGLARIVNEAGLTMTGDLVGTLRYMSPEQALAKRATMDARTDVYSLGATLYELLTLEPVYNGRNREEVLRQIAFDEPRLPSRLNKAVPVDLQTIVLKAMAKSPEERYATAGELANDLRRFLVGEPVWARPARVWERAAKWARRRPAVAALIAVSVAAFLSIFGGTLWHNARQRAALIKADTNLYDSLLNGARATRRAREDGYRVEVFNLLKQALTLKTSKSNLSELRQEASACFGDFVGLESTTWEDFPVSIGSAALHANGRLLALGLFDGMIQLRRIPDGGIVASLRGHRCYVAALAFRAGGKELVSADGSGKIMVWQVERDGTWTCGQKFDIERTVPLLMPSLVFPFFTTTEISSGSVPALADFTSASLTPDGRYLAASWWNSAVALVDIAKQTARQFPVPNGEDICGLAVSPDGKLLTGAYVDQGRYGVLVWDIRTRALQKRLTPGLGQPYCIGFSPDSRFMVCTHDEGLALYDTATFERRPFERGDLPCGIAFSPDGQLLAYQANNLRSIRLWDISRNRYIAALKCRHAFWVTFSKDGKKLVAVTTGLVRIWNLAGADEKIVLKGHAAAISSVVFSPDGKLLATSGRDYKVKIWNPTTCRLLKELDFSTAVETISFSPDGRVLAAGGFDDGRVRFYDVKSWQALTVMEPCVGNRVLSTAFSADGRHFAAAGTSGLRLWRIVRAAGEQAIKTTIPFQSLGPLTKNTARAVCFSPNGNWLAWVEEDWSQGLYTVNVWDLRSLQLHALAKARSCPMKALGFSSDSRQLTFINDKLAIAVWDVIAKQELPSFGELAEKTQPRPKTDLSADGIWYAVADQTVTIWDMKAKELLVALSPERSSVCSVGWSPDRKLLAVGGNDGGLEIWDLPKINAKLAEIGLGW